jgi:hypothetical protein
MRRDAVAAAAVPATPPPLASAALRLAATSAPASAASAEVDSDFSDGEVEVFHTAAALPALTPSFFLPAAPVQQQELRAADDMDELQLVDSDQSDGEVEVFHPALLPVAVPAVAQQELRVADDMDELQLVDSDQSDGEVEVFHSALLPVAVPAVEQQELRVADDMDEFDFDSTVDLQSIACQELSAATSSPAPSAAAHVKYSKAAPLVVATSTAIGQSLDVRACSFSDGI